MQETEWGRSPGEGNGNTLQDSCLGNSMDGGDWSPPWGHKRVRNDLATKQQQQFKHLSFSVDGIQPSRKQNL